MGNAVSKKGYLQNEFDREKVAYLAGRYVDLRAEEILGNREPEAIAKELRILTIELTDLSINDKLSPKKRLKILEKVNERSFGDLYTFGMKGNKKIFNQSMVDIIEQVVVEESIRKGNTITANIAAKAAKPVEATA